MRKVKIIIDLDGTIYRGNQLIDHANSFLTMLNDKNFDYKFFTNCPMRTPGELVHVLKGMGLEVNENNIVTSGCIARRYIQSSDKRTRVYVIGSASFKEYLQAGNIELVTIADMVADYVLVGFCTDFTYEQLTRALWHIQKGAKFITTNTDDTIPVGNSVEPHTGAICAFLELVSKQKPFNLGKPSEYAGDYFREIFSSYDVIVVGDRIDTDMMFARNNGFIGCLVLTGIAEQQLYKNKKQHFSIFRDLQELCEFLEYRE